MLFGVQSFLFKMILKLQVANYSMFLLSGLLPWIFFTQSILMCTGSLVASGRLLKSFPVHAQVYLMAQLLDNLVNFIAALVVIGIPVGIFASHWGLSILLLPIPVVILLVGVTAMCLIAAVIQVFFRDTLFIVSFVLQVVFFVTPIFFPPSYVPERFRWIIQVNVVYYLIKPFRTLLYDYQLHDFLMESAQAALIAAAMLGVSIFVWRKCRNAIYFNI